MDEIGGETEEVEHGRLDDDGLEMGVAMDAGEGGVGEIGGKPCLDASNLGKGLLGGGAKRLGARAVEGDLEARGHGHGGDADDGRGAVVERGHGEGSAERAGPMMGPAPRMGQDPDTDPTRLVSAASMASMRRWRWASPEAISASVPTPLLTRDWASGVR